MRLVASDMDGTIVGRDGRMSGRTVKAFRDCAAAGVDVVFVTGRPPRWLDPLRDQLQHRGTVI
jgi:HAD superfamily hydrolase (TIGR01484 family)